MLEYINSGTTNDKATVSLNNEVIEAMVLLAKPDEVPGFKGTE